MLLILHRWRKVAQSNSLALLNGKSVQFSVEEEETIAASADVYPNPAISTINITCSENATAEIIDVNGKVVVSSIAITVNVANALNIHNLAAGVYTVKIYNANFATVKELIVK